MTSLTDTPNIFFDKNDEDMSLYLASPVIEILQRHELEGVSLILVKEIGVGVRLVIEPATGMRTLFNPTAALQK
jgi:hypothetical protein